MKIGEAAAASGCHLETVRYYERIGLLPAPPRTSGGYRDYRPADVDRLRFVSRGRDLGFSLPEIRRLLRLAENEPMYCHAVDPLARGHLKNIRPPIDALQRIASTLELVNPRPDGREWGPCTLLDTVRHPP